MNARRSLNQGSAVLTLCPECGHEGITMVVDKTTDVCAKCDWPVDVYEDGTIVDSPLAEVRGVVRNGVHRGFCCIRNEVRTRHG